MIEGADRDSVAWISLLPPTHSGIAEYSSTLLPLLQKHLDVYAIDPTSVSNVEEIRGKVNRYVYNIGNHEINRKILDTAEKFPDAVILHDTSCFNALPLPEKARAWQDAGVWTARAEDLHPWLKEFLLNQKLLMVHDHDPADRLRMAGVTPPISIIPMPVVPPPQKVGIPEGPFSVGVFGYIGENRHLKIVEKVCARLRIPLYLVGKVYDSFSPSWDGTINVGWVPKPEWWKYMKKVHMVLNLRYPVMGEVSLTTLEAFASERPVMGLDVGSFSSLPASAVIRIPPGDDISDRLHENLYELSRSPARIREMGAQGYIHVTKHHNPEQTVNGILAALRFHPSRIHVG